MAKQGRPRLHSNDEIAQAILDLGVETFSTPALAKRLGNKAHAAVYGHFRDREAMVEAALERAVMAADWPVPAQPWKVLLQGIGESSWAICDAYEGFDRAMVVRRWPGGSKGLFDAYIREFEVQGFERRDAAIVIDLVRCVAVSSHASSPAGLVGYRRLYERQLAVILQGAEELVNSRVSEG